MKINKAIILLMVSCYWYGNIGAADLKAATDRASQKDILEAPKVLLGLYKKWLDLTKERKKSLEALSNTYAANVKRQEIYFDSQENTLLRNLIYFIAILPGALYAVEYNAFLANETSTHEDNIGIFNKVMEDIARIHNVK
jgi:hypothetical protein